VKNATEKRGGYNQKKGGGLFLLKRRKRKDGTIVRREKGKVDLQAYSRKEGGKKKRSSC